ncbi:RagB/SusD family nutrient uptake outer membrane protein [Flavobacterium oreochromis]|uniref:RagB/SusD family nutrient uptake outer membrane protein n=1 Tax=Flavobacterium oreochromis TaxID=2906078 RepID=A0ABW8PAQ5_9FLAO|nr:RagB/SusD family nutrient uptake outer membrane protein [Flavobacterium oreochromis]OWP77122.1 hypothetical protein BWG23_05955 [Flavobacterium oreochromis]QYS85340.1 RagB/SusD family nutrient uptake outer membrane protein [Flavobacterium oreochromis]
MKNFYISALFLSLIFGGCQTDLNVSAQDESSRDVVFNTGLGVKSFTTGLYGLAQQEGAFGGVPQLLGEWQSDNIGFRGTFPTLIEIRDYTTISTNGNIASIWQDHYEIITQANTIISRAYSTPDVDFSKEERDQVVGEAKFMRALAYFQLNCLFAQPIQTVGSGGLSVPLVTQYVKSVDEIGLRSTARATIGQIYNQIELDLLDAINKITKFDRSRANIGAAKALLARVYLYQNKFDLAANYANQVINMPEFTFANDYLFYDNKTSSEHIFNLVSLTNDSQSGSNENGPSVSFSTLTNSSTQGGRGDCPFSANLNATFSASNGDLRYTLKRADEINSARFFTTKYDDGKNQSSDFSVIRISEMYLIRAEANLRAGTAVGANPIDDVNKIRRRARVADLTAPLTLDNIITERRLEFCFEGHRRMDLLRNGIQLRSSGTVPAPTETMPGKPKVILPIPQRELDLNKNLIQNSGY